MKKIVLIASTFYCAWCTFTFAQNSPVVQVVSYKEPLGLYFSLQGWWSGSIIDNQGHIITNNHVVDDGAGGISDDFAICMTDDPALPPKCYYTASVIDRDINADIAVLKLDTTDIFWKSVNFSTLSTLPMNTEYIPESGDTVTAHGYPWVWANTITKTQGIVSGTVQHNGQTYIKTDTLIAGGNSGGPLVKEGALVGVNTFLVGGGYDPSLGYSLSIREVADFLAQALSQKKPLQTNNVQFSHFLQTVENFSTKNTIQDPLISIRLPEKYTLQSYIPSTSLLAILSDANTTSVTSFGFYHTQIPRISDVTMLQRYLGYEMGAQDIELSPVMIGGKTFYEVIFTQDNSQKTKNVYIYVSLVDETHLLVLYLETPVPTKNTLDALEKSVKSFLQNVTFPWTFIFPKTPNVALPMWIRLLAQRTSSLSYDVTEYRGFLWYFIRNRQDFVLMKNYLWSFWQRAQVAVFRNSFETEDMTPEMWLKDLTKDMYQMPVLKKQITYKWHDGFLICLNDSLLDMDWKKQDIISCETVIFVGEKREYILSIHMILAQEQRTRIEKLMIQYMNKVLDVPNIGETVFSPWDQTVHISYTDVGNQTPAYQQVLSMLISYGVLQKHPQFWWDTPLLWRDYIRLYVWAVYHKKMTDTVIPGGKTYEQILSAIPLSLDDYAEDDSWQVDAVNTLIRLLMAGWSLSKYDFDTIYAFSQASYETEGVYKDAWDTIYAFESKYFPHKTNMLTAQYTSQNRITYNPFTGLHTWSVSEASHWDFFRNTQKDKEKTHTFLQCDTSSATYFSAKCRDIRKTALLESLSYTVLTKGKAIEYILEHIDPTLWMQGK